MLVDTLALKLHVDAGIVWTLRGCEHPASTRCNVADAIGGNLLDSKDTVRVVGTRENAELILKLYEYLSLGGIRSLQLVTPLVCSTAADRRRPEAVLYHMRRFNKSPSLGGYHEATKDDFVAYALAVELDNCDGDSLTECASRLLDEHPAWRHMTFIPDLHKVECAKLLATILDPRWYIDLCKPDRGAKLEAYLGLNPKTQDCVTSRLDGPRWRHHARCTLVADCWFSLDMFDAVNETYDKYGIKDFGRLDECGLRPGDFLWRIWGTHMGVPWSNKLCDHVKAQLRASQKFVNFIRLTWLAQLYSSCDYVDASLFRASDFFPHVVEVQAYNHYILQR